jgi:CRISPR-associated protein Csb3
MSTPSITVTVDPTNPGQFFACCGLLELADRLWPGAEGWFGAGGLEFHVACGEHKLEELLSAIRKLQLANPVEDDEDGSEEAEDDDIASFEPMIITSPVTLQLDWWQEKGLKPWAGSMKAPVIAIAMARGVDSNISDPLNQATVVRDPDKVVLAKGGRERIVIGKPREPFYFDARRGTNVLDRDVGFVPDSLKKAYKVYTFAYPVVEIFSLIGLQRGRPRPTMKPRVYDYFTWTFPINPVVLPAAVIGNIGDSKALGFRFRNAFRTGQRKHKTFTPAIPLSKGAD